MNRVGITLNDLVSVIVPAFNAADTVKASIQAALEQLYDNVEIIVVDDGSTDATGEICRGCARSDPRVVYIHQANSGVSAARNAGIRAARGQYVAFLDADDLWDPEKLSLQVALAKRSPDTVVLTALQRFCEDGAGREMLSRTSPPEYLNRESYLTHVINLSGSEMAIFGTALVPKEHLEVVGGFDECLTTAEDWDLWVRLAVHFPFANVGRALRLYRKYSGSLTTRADFDRTLRGQLYIVDKLASSGVLPPAVTRMAKVRRCWEAALTYRRLGRKWAAMRALARAGACGHRELSTLLVGALAKKRQVTEGHPGG